MPYEKLKEEHYTNLRGQNTKSSNYMTQEGESLRIVNMDFTSVGAWTKVPGTTQFLGATVAGAVGGLVQFTRLTGSSYVIASANTTLYTVTGGAFSGLRSGLLNDSIFDFVPFVDRLFAANGQDVFKTDGVNSYFYSLPAGNNPGFSLAPTGSISFTGFFQYAYGYQNERGYQGPVSTAQGISVAGTRIVIGGMSFPTGFGITAINVYRSENNLSSLFLIGSVDPGATFIDIGYSLTDVAAPAYTYLTLVPRYLELYNNQMFLAGFSSAPSTTYFSAIGEPEGIGATAFFEVRTNDGDRITAMQSYYNQLIFFKFKSFHALSGDNPQNFSLRQLSDQYGCVSNRATATYKDQLLFLDRKGILQFNGANIDVISTPMEDVFLRMNIEAAREQAAMLHVKERNEVWTLFPVDGSTLNNQLVVYDYNINAWYERKGLDVRTLALIQRDYPYATPAYGSYSGTLFNFDSILMGDNGAAMTCSVLTRFHAPLGNSTEAMFRRLWLDVNPLPTTVGGTVSINVQFFANQGLSSPVLTRTMTGATWQSRIDFGVSAKSLAFGFEHASESQGLVINGYTIAHRFQRNV